jgi:hypothetical protein
MSKAKFATLILVAAVLLSGCSALKEVLPSEDGQPVAEKIAGFTLPDGYSEQFSVDLLGYQMVSLEGPASSCHIYLLQAPENADVDVADLQKQAAAMEGSRHPGGLRDLQIVETRTATLRGQEVPVVVGEGINSDDRPYRQVNALFEGRGGPALVNISSPVAEWDWTLVDEFLASIE